MIDLTIINKDLFPVTMIDGEVIHLRRPSQKLLLDLFKVGGWLQSKDVFNGIEAVAETVLTMINNNKEGIKYTLEYVNQLDVGIAFLLVSEYVDYWYQELGE